MADAAPAVDPAADLPKPFALGALGIIVIGLIFLSVLVGLFFVGYLPQHAAQVALDQTAKDQVVANGTAHVRIAKPKPAPDSITVTLPATLAANQQTTIYARATGFVRAWHKDLGDKVNAGDVLAEIDAPDIDQDLAQGQAAIDQAKAQVAQAVANQTLAAVSLKRQRSVGPGIASQQDIDAAQATYDGATATVQLDQATVTADIANVQRLTDLVSFEKITAPFSGVITSRQIQVGNLVTAGTGAGQALFQVSQVDPMLVFVNLPQPQTAGIAIGDKATVSIREFGDATFTGTVSNIAGLLDPNAHTMVVELQIPNHDGRLLPGMYATASIAVPTRRKLWLIPSNALMLGAKGAQVAVVTADSHIHLKPVTIDLDTGANLIISAGLEAGDQVALDPGEYVVEGAPAEIVPDGAAAGATSAATATGSAPTAGTGGTAVEANASASAAATGTATPDISPNTAPGPSTTAVPATVPANR